MFFFSKLFLKKLETFKWLTYVETFCKQIWGVFLKKKKKKNKNKKDHGIWMMNNMHKHKIFDSFGYKLI